MPPRLLLFVATVTCSLLPPLLCPGTGNIVRADIVYGRDGRSRGYGTVRYETVEEASAAIEQFNGGCSGQGGHVNAGQGAQGGLPAPACTTSRPPSSSVSTVSVCRGRAGQLQGCSGP